MPEINCLEKTRENIKQAMMQSKESNSAFQEYSEPTHYQNNTTIQNYNFESSEVPKKTLWQYI